MANSEAWTNLGEVGKLLFIQKYAIEEIHLLKPKCGMSKEEAQTYENRLHKLFALFMFNQERVNVAINPAHYQVQINLTDRIRKLVTSYLVKLVSIVHDGTNNSPISIDLYPNSNSPSVFDFAKSCTPNTNMEDWLAYENYLILSQDVRDFNILCSSVPHDILPLIKQFNKEGAIVFELEQIVNNIRSNIDFGRWIDAEIETIERYQLFEENVVEFEGFVKMANQAMRILMVCYADVEESNDDKIMLMVNRITDRFPRVVKGKWAKEVSKGGDKSSFVKLRNFLMIPVQDLVLEKYSIVERRSFSRIFGRIFSKILAMLRWW